MKRELSSNSDFFLWLNSKSANSISRTASSISQLWKNTQLIFSEIKNRKSLKALLNASNEQLEDIGLNRTILKKALQLPLNQNASAWLRKNKINKYKTH